jgi:hypothetical protein
MPVFAFKVKPESDDHYHEPTDSIVRQPKQFVPPETKARAKKLTLAWGGRWKEDKACGRNAFCPIPDCGCFEVAITPKRAGVLMCCNGCGAGKRKGDSRLLDAAAAAGFECGPGVDRRRRPDLSKLQPASESALAGLKPAEKRVLAFCAKQTRTRDWVEVSQGEIVGTCSVSCRDAIPLLDRLAARGLIRVRSNEYKLKRRTQIGFLVDPADLVRRFGTA